MTIVVNQPTGELFEIEIDDGVAELLERYVDEVYAGNWNDWFRAVVNGFIFVTRSNDSSDREDDYEVVWSGANKHASLIGERDSRQPIGAVPGRRHFIGR